MGFPLFCIRSGASEDDDRSQYRPNNANPLDSGRCFESHCGQKEGGER